MTPPFSYPSGPRIRRHGPAGYADYASYRPWLRDEFSFQCVYCLTREQWGRVRGQFDLDHFAPTAQRPDLTLDYDNLIYACATCNSAKGAATIPDPLNVLLNERVFVSDDGRLHANTPEAVSLIEILGLNDEDTIEFRMMWIGIIALAAKVDVALHQRLMTFPADLPDLTQLRPPGGNKRPEGVNNSWFARRERGEIPSTY